MLTFLRKIRKSLIESSPAIASAKVGGSSRKYLLYAIGEIALVVIGILIALQINNWNSHRLEVHNLKSNLTYVLEDIEYNKIQLQELKQERNYALQSCSKVINLYKKSLPLPLSIFIKMYAPIVIEQRFKINDNGIKRVKSSEIYESEPLNNIRYLIKAYVDLINENHYTESKLNTHIEAMEKELFSNGFYDGIWDFLRAKFINSEIYELPSEDPDIIYKMKRFDALVGIFLRYEVESPIIIREYDAIIAKGEELREEVLKYLSL